MSLALAWLLLKHRPFRALVMAPGHLVRKWRREVEWLIPNVHCQIIRNFSDMQRFHEKSKMLHQPMIAVIGKKLQSWASTLTGLLPRNAG